MDGNLKQLRSMVQHINDDLLRSLLPPEVAARVGNISSEVAADTGGATLYVWMKSGDGATTRPLRFDLGRDVVVDERLGMLRVPQHVLTRIALEASRP